MGAGGQQPGESGGDPPLRASAGGSAPAPPGDQPRRVLAGAMAFAPSLDEPRRVYAGTRVSKPRDDQPRYLRTWRDLPRPLDPVHPVEGWQRPEFGASHAGRDDSGRRARQAASDLREERADAPLERWPDVLDRIDPEDGPSIQRKSPYDDTELPEPIVPHITPREFVLPDCCASVLALVDGQEFDAVATADSEHGFIPEPSVTACTEENANAREPLGSRLMLAVSTDGLTWTKTGLVIANHGSVPCLAVEDRVVYLYFCVTRPDHMAAGATWGTVELEDAKNAGDPNNTERSTPIAVAYTRDLLNWTYRLIGDEGKGFHFLETDKLNWNLLQYWAVDPSVVPAPADSGYAWYMYFTLHPIDPDGRDGHGAAIFVAGAESLAACEWQMLVVDPVLPPPDAPAGSRAEDPSAVEVLGGYLLFAGGNQPDMNWRALTDAEGLTVASGDWDEFEETCTDPLLMNNALAADASPTGDLTWYATVATADSDEKYIVATTVDEDGEFVVGTDATGGCAMTVQEDQAYEHEGIREVAVAKLRLRGCWVMVYSTGIPPTRDSTR